MKTEYIGRHSADNDRKDENGWTFQVVLLRGVWTCVSFGPWWCPVWARPE